MENQLKLRINIRIPDIVVHRPLGIKRFAELQLPVTLRLQEPQSAQLIRYLPTTQTNKRVVQRHSDR